MIESKREIWIQFLTQNWEILKFHIHIMFFFHSTWLCSCNISVNLYLFFKTNHHHDIHSRTSIVFHMLLTHISVNIYHVTMNLYESLTPHAFFFFFLEQTVFFTYWVSGAKHNPWNKISSQQKMRRKGWKLELGWETFSW